MDRPPTRRMRRRSTSAIPSSSIAAGTRGRAAGFALGHGASLVCRKSRSPKVERLAGGGLLGRGFLTALQKNLLFARIKCPDSAALYSEDRSVRSSQRPDLQFPRRLVVGV